MKEAPGSKKEAPRRDSAAVFSNSDDDDEDDALFYSGMHQQIIKKGKELGDLPPKLKQNAKLEKLRKALSTKADASNNESGVADNEDLSDWGTIRLTFAPERGKDGMSRKEDPNDYVVHDPLLEKGKEKFNQMRAKQKRQEREWAGKPLA